MVAEARDEPGALPLVENALHWLVAAADGRSPQRPSCSPIRAGSPASSAAAPTICLQALARQQRDRALELLFRLVRVDREGFRHARSASAWTRRWRSPAAARPAGPWSTACPASAGRTAARRQGPLRLITVSDEGIGQPDPRDADPQQGSRRRRQAAALLADAVGLHRDSTRSGRRGGSGCARRAAWLEKGRGAGYQWSHERVREAARGAAAGVAELSPDEREFLGPIDPEEMLAELEKPETTHKRRLLIGERLDVLGDPRRGVGVDANGTPGSTGGRWTAAR